MEAIVPVALAVVGGVFLLAFKHRIAFDRLTRAATFGYYALFTFYSGWMARKFIGPGGDFAADIALYVGMGFMVVTLVAAWLSRD